MPPIKWDLLSEDEKNQFLMKSDKKDTSVITKHDWYIDESVGELSPIVWSDDYIESYLLRFTRDNIINNKHGAESYNNASMYHIIAIEKFNITNKKIAIIGSQTPWIEAIFLNYNNVVTTVEYNVPICNKFETISYTDFVNTEDKYDIVVSYSSIEHSGLGRYGDPINPNADIDTVNVIHDKLKDNGLLLLGIPVGKDSIVWNAHRVYGHKRLGLLIKNFDEIEWIGVSKQFLDTCGHANNGPQPIIALKKKNE